MQTAMMVIAMRLAILSLLARLLDVTVGRGVVAHGLHGDERVWSAEELADLEEKWGMEVGLAG
jgi:hypothetical protein